MNTITLTIAATPDNLKKLAEAFGGAIDDTLQADAVPATRRSGELKAPKGETVKPAEIPAENAQKPSESTKDPQKSEENVDLSMLRAKGAQLVKDGHKDEIKTLLAKHGAAKIPDLAEADYAAFYEEMEAVG